MRQVIHFSIVFIVVATGFLVIGGYTSTAGKSVLACVSTPIGLSDPVNGLLESGDCVDTNTALYDGHTFAGTAGERIDIALGSETFAASVRLVQGSYPGGVVVATGVEAESGRRRITNFTIPASGNYTIVASSSTAGITGAYTLSLEPTIPRVDLIQRTSTNPALPGTVVGYSIFFSSAMTGVDASDFTLTTNGVSGAAITSVSGGGSIYTVAVNTGAGAGSLRLDLIDNDSIVNTLGTSLGGAGAGNGNFTTGPAYTIAASTPTPSPTQSTIIVTNANDEGAGSLRQAIADIAPGGTITFSPVFNSAQTITLSTGELRITKPVTINGPGQNLVTISGNNVSRVFNLGGSSPVIDIAISGMTITGGRAPDDDFGGGIESNFVNLTLTNSTVAGNSAPGNSFGGGGGIDSFEGTLTIDGCTITGNQANRTGGGIMSEPGPLTIRNSVITLNQTFSPQGAGGGIHGTGQVRVIESIVQGNQVSPAGGSGGGVHFTGGSQLDIQLSTIRNNRAANGGGLSVTGLGSPMTMTRSTIDANTAAQQGGGILVRNSDATIDHSTISGNTANGSVSSGAAILMDITNGGRILSVRNSTIAANTALPSVGGGIALSSRSSTTASATLQLRSSIVANNSAPNLRTVTADGAAAVITSQGFNLTSDSGAGALTQPTDKTNVEPGIGPLADNGGPTRTHALLQNSVALDAGDSAGSAVDQRGNGFVRIVDLAIPNASGGDGSDIGAFEAQTEPVSQLATVSGRVFTPSGLALRNAIVTMADPQGVRRTSTTSSFGVFSFENVATGQSYILTVTSKRYRFAAQTRQVNGDLANIDFVGLE